MAAITEPTDLTREAAEGIRLPGRRRLIVTADDFGLSSSVNAAVIQAHREGILTTASLMVNEPGFAEAVAMARAHPGLGVGLHLTLLQGRSTLAPQDIPGLVDGQGEFTKSPTGAGMRYFFKRSLVDQLRREIQAQVDKFKATGLKLDHINGHLHMHLHPTIFPLLLEATKDEERRAMRLTRDSLKLSRGMTQGRWGYRLSHAVIFQLLSNQAQETMQEQKIRFTRITFGLMQNGLVDEAYVLKLLPHLPPGATELYSHPSLGTFRHEYEALISRRVREQVAELGIELIRYQDLE